MLDLKSGDLGEPTFWMLPSNWLSRRGIGTNVAIRFLGDSQKYTLAENCREIFVSERDIGVIQPKHR